MLVVLTEDQAARAKAFVGHNRDRVAITPMQLHYSAIAAGDENALTLHQVAGRAGVKILRSPPGGGQYKPRETVAVQGCLSLCNRRGAMGARKVLEVCANAEMAPISDAAVKAIDLLLYGDEYKDTVAPEDLTSTIMKLGDAALREAKVFAQAHRVPIWRGLAVVLYRNTRKQRKSA